MTFMLMTWKISYIYSTVIARIVRYSVESEFREVLINGSRSLGLLANTIGIFVDDTIILLAVVNTITCFRKTTKKTCV